MSSSLAYPRKHSTVHSLVILALVFLVTAGSLLGASVPAFAEEGHSDDTSGALAPENANNAEIPEEGDYTCIKPGRHEFLATLVNNSQARAVMLDYTGQGEPVHRENYSVVVPVPDYTMNTVSAEDTKAGFNVIATEGTPVWTLPQAESSAAAWIAISSAQWDYTKSDALGLNFHIQTLTGPGQMKLWSYDQESGIQVRVDSTDDSLKVTMDKPGSTHLNTSFTVPGFYEVDYAFSAYLHGARPKAVTAGYLVYYAVGDDMVRKVCGDEFVQKPPSGSTNDSMSDATGGGGSTAGSNTNQPTDTPDHNNQGQDKEDTATGSGQPNPGDASSSQGGTAQSQDEANGDKQTQAPTTETGDDKKNDSQTAGSSDGNSGARQDTSLGATDGKTTGKTTDRNKHQGEAILNVASPEDTLKSSQEGRRRARAPQNHPSVGNNEPEVCEAVVITRESEPEEADKVRRAQGEEGTARTVINVSVGDNARGNVHDGHFDLGALVDNDTVYARVKDDRTQPAQWLDPADLVFALGKPAEITAPEALNFVVPTGKKVWMVQQSQQKNVPWIGMNSQHPSILSKTTGSVTFTLEAVDGPGKVAVFSSGSFGGGVGEIVFDGAGSSYTIGINTHAHHNWVFTEPGNYSLTLSMKVEGKNGVIKGSNGVGGNFIVTGEVGPNGRPIIKETVGRTPSGQECDLNAGRSSGSGLAKTGTSNILPLLISTLGVGIVMLTARKRRV